MNQEELNLVLAKHKKWLNSEEGGERANLRKVDLRKVDLRWADLREADLRGVDLQGANLQWADLRKADLREADLRGVDLQGANLQWADLRKADLRGVKLWGTVGNRKEIKNISCFEEYCVAYTKDRLQIGCENHSFDEWREFSDRDILAMDGKKALEFWNNNKAYIFITLDGHPAIGN